MTREEITVLKDHLLHTKRFTRDKSAISIDQGLALIDEIERLEAEIASSLSATKSGPTPRVRRHKPTI